MLRKYFKGDIGAELKPKKYCLCETPIPDLILSYLFNDRWDPKQFDDNLSELYNGPARTFRLLINLTTPYWCQEKVSKVTWRGNNKSLCQLIFLHMLRLSLLDLMHDAQAQNFLKTNRIVRNNYSEPFILSAWPEISSPFIMDKMMNRIGRCEFARRLQQIFNEELGTAKIKPASFLQMLTLLDLCE